jgi:hypothetical protein
MPPWRRARSQLEQRERIRRGRSCLHTSRPCKKSLARVIARRCLSLDAKLARAGLMRTGFAEARDYRRDFPAVPRI